MLKSKYTVDVIYYARLESPTSPFTPASFQWWGNFVPALLGVETVQEGSLSYFPSPQTRHYRPYSPSQPTWAEISICLLSPLPTFFLSEHSDGLRESRSITSRNPLAFINSDHYEHLSHRESKRGIENVVFVLRNLKGFKALASLPPSHPFQLHSSKTTYC